MVPVPRDDQDARQGTRRVLGGGPPHRRHARHRHRPRRGDGATREGSRRRSNAARVHARRVFHDRGGVCVTSRPPRRRGRRRDGVGIGRRAVVPLVGGGGAAAAGWETRLRAAATVAAFALFALSAAFVTDGKSLDVVLHTAGVEGWTDPWADEEKDEDDETTEMDSVAARASRVGLGASATKGSATTATTTATATTIVPGTSTVPGTPAAPASVRVASGSVAATSSSTPRTPGSAARNLRRLGSIHRLIRGVSASVSSPGSRRSVSAESLGAGEDAFVHRSLPPPAAWSEAFASGAGAGARAPVGIRLSPERPHRWLPSGPARARADGVSCPTQVPFAFESELFSGVAVVYLRGLPDSPSRVFDGKARAIQFTVQGRFKKPVPMDDLHFGVRLARPMRKLPTRWLLQLCTRVVRSLGAPYSMELTDPTHRTRGCSRPSRWRVRR